MSEYGEPWVYNSCNVNYHVIGENGLIMSLGAEAEESMMPNTCEVARIVACVNACAGIPTDELVPLLERLRELEKRLDDEENRAWERSEQKE